VVITAGVVVVVVVIIGWLIVFATVQPVVSHIEM
jgi:hypothetical protein